jgi:PAS domain S-box-containing protein
MKIDIHTMALVVCVTNILQLISLSILYRVKMSHAGLGCWIVASGTSALGFACNYLRDIPGIGPFAIVANNTLFVASLAFVYAGVLRFFNRRESITRLGAFCLAVTLIAFYFTFIDDSQAARRVMISFSICIMSLLIVRALYVHRERSVSASTFFLMLVFLVHGLFLLLRGMAPLSGAAVGALFSASLTQTATYMIVLTCSTLWTLGFIIMISQRLAFENREVRERFELIFNTSPDAILITRLSDGCIVDCNDGFTIMSGFKRGELFGNTTVALKIWHNSEERQQMLRAFSHGSGRLENLEVTVHPKKGGHIIGILSATLFNLSGEPHVLSVTRDITERKTQELKLLQAKAETETALIREQKMLQEQRHFLSMVSHEFRTPLAVIDTAATNLTAVPPLDQNDLDQRAQQIRRANRSLVQLIDNCLTSDRIEMGGFQVCRMETELLPLLFEMTRIVNNSPKRSIQLEYSEAPATWFLDTTLIRVALANLVDNAVKYSDGGAIIVRARRQEDALLISVANRGDTIGDEEIEALFRKFVRGKTAQNGRNIRGSGLGLYISRRIAEAHNGNVYLVPCEKGTTMFEMRIPVERRE